MNINIDRKQIFIILSLSCIIFIPRFLNLDAFLNPDGAGRWFYRSILFYAGIAHLQDYDLTTTLQTGHPGVTLMILSGASMSLAQLIKYGNLDIVGHAPELFFYAKLPIAIITGLGIIFVYLLLSKFYKKNYFPLTVTIFLCIDPFFLAHSRYFQLDALTAIFMLFALLSTAIYCQHGNTRSIIFAGLFTGLALLSKSYSVSLIPFIIAALVLQKYWTQERGQNFKLVKALVTWILVAILTFIVLWPSMWVQPVKSVTRIFGDTKFSVTHTHENSGSLAENKQGIVSQPVERGIRFKPDLVVDFINKSPSIILFLGGLALIIILNKLYRREMDTETELVAFFSVFFFFYLFGMSLSGKAGIRYCVISFILFDIMAAYGFISILSWVREANINHLMKQVVPVLLLVLLCTHSVGIFYYHPYYQDYQNKFFFRDMMGGAWGEGLEKIGAYLNDKPGSENLKVAAFYAPVLKQFYKGTTVPLQVVETEKPDYIVLYASQVDRYLFPELVKKYYLNPDQKPEFVARINGHEYAWLYVNRDKYPTNSVTHELQSGTASINSTPNQ